MLSERICQEIQLPSLFPSPSWKNSLHLFISSFYEKLKNKFRINIFMYLYDGVIYIYIMRCVWGGIFILVVVVVFQKKSSFWLLPDPYCEKSAITGISFFKVLWRHIMAGRLNLYCLMGSTNGKALSCWKVLHECQDQVSMEQNYPMYFNTWIWVFDFILKISSLSEMIEFWYDIWFCSKSSEQWDGTLALASWTFCSMVFKVWFITFSC